NHDRAAQLVDVAPRGRECVEPRPLPKGRASPQRFLDRRPVARPPAERLRAGRTKVSQPDALLLAETAFLGLQFDEDDAIATHGGDVRITGVAAERRSPALRGLGRSAVVPAPTKSVQRMGDRLLKILLPGDRPGLWSQFLLD